MLWELLTVSVAVVLLVVVTRRYLRGHRAPVDADYGLLREVATASSDAAARAAAARLGEHGIRVTTAPSADGERLRIMVFAVDEQRAIRLLLEEDWPS